MTVDPKIYKTSKFRFIAVTGDFFFFWAYEVYEMQVMHGIAVSLIPLDSREAIQA